MSIKIEVSVNAFIDMYGQSEFCRSFTLDAQEEILRHIEDLQHESDAVIDWTEVFMNAAEYTAKELINEYDKDVETDSMGEDDLEFIADQIFNNDIDEQRVSLTNGNYVIF